MVSPSASAKHQSEVLQLTAWGRSRALIQALIAEAHRAFQVPVHAAYSKERESVGGLAVQLKYP